MKAGVIGWPINHSKSPIIHNHWMQQYGIKGTYTAIAVKPDDLKSEVARLVAEGFRGFNVTVPHKQTIMPFLNSISTEAEKIGAVNTVVIGPNGMLEGRNTDAYGFIENLKENAKAFNFKTAKVTVLGAGGAACAAVYALQKEGVAEIRIVNRTLAHAKELADAFHRAPSLATRGRGLGEGDMKIIQQNISLSPTLSLMNEGEEELRIRPSAHAWQELPDILKTTTLLINTTSLGMTGKEDLTIDLTPLPKTALVHDIVYTPLETSLLRLARVRGNPTVTGIGMLLHQARPAFEAWFGVLPDIDEALRQKALA